MTDDLTTRLLAAIQQVEDSAVLATSPTRWAPGQPVTRVQVVGLDGKTQYDSVTTAILRHCSAHRKIVADCAHVLQAIEEVLSRPHPGRDEFGGIYLARELATKTLASMAVAYDLTTEPAP